MIADNQAAVATNVEIQKVLSKLRELVPGIPTDRKMSKLEIMQHVIDYISDLEQILDSETATGTTTKQVKAPHPFQMVN